MKRTPLRRRARLRARTQLRRTKPLQRTASLAATDAQRAAVAGRRCVACGSEQRIDPAHLIPRPLGGCGDALCVVPLCRCCHRAYDSGELDLLWHLEPAWRAQLAHAVGHVGLIGALRNQRRDGPRRRAPRDRRVVSDADSATRTGGSLEVVPTLVRDPQPAEFEAMLERRRRLGQDLFDEVWEGVRHMNPAPSGRHGDLESQLHVLLASLAKRAGLRMRGQFNLGADSDYRVPDGGLQQDTRNLVYYPTAALVIEIVSPGDESWEKLSFYAVHGVQELLIVDPEAQTVSWLALEAGNYQHVKRSRLIELGADALAGQIDWR